VARGFIPLAALTGSHIILYVRIHPWPEEVSSYQLDGFALTHMPGDLGIVLSFADFAS